MKKYFGCTVKELKNELIRRGAYLKGKKEDLPESVARKNVRKKNIQRIALKGTNYSGATKRPSLAVYIPIEEFGDEESLAEKQRNILPLIEEHRNFINHVASKLQKLKQEEEQIRREIRNQEAELQSVKDVEQQRLMILRQKSRDAYKGVIWLRQNTDKFSKVIHEPMLLKINVKSAQYSKYFENCIPHRDLCAFVCENKQDMNLLRNYLRDQQGLQVNCVHLDPDENINMNPRIPIESIAQFGFENYLSSLVDAPQTILKYLVSMYRINNILIGNDNVENNFEQVPNGLNSFYSGNNYYSVSTSKYSGAKSTRISRVVGDGSLSIILDTTKLETIQARLAQLNDQKITVANNTVEVERKLAEAEEKMRELWRKRRECQQYIDQIKTVRIRITMATRKINDLQTQRTSIEEIKETNKRYINDIIMNQIKDYKKYNKALEEYIETSNQNASAKLEIQLSQRTLAVKLNEYREMKDGCTAAERTVRKYDNELRPLQAEAKRMYEDALAITSGLGPRDEGFEKLAKAFSKLPATVEEISDELKVAQTKVLCLDNAPDVENILQDCEKVKVDVENLKQDIEAKSTELQTIIQEMSSLRLHLEAQETYNNNSEEDTVDNNDDEDDEDWADDNDDSGNYDVDEDGNENVDTDDDNVDENEYDNLRLEDEEMTWRKATNRKMVKPVSVVTKDHTITPTSGLIECPLENERRMNVQKHEEPQSNAIDTLFSSIASTVKSFSPYYQNIAKSRIFKIITDLEMEQITQSQPAFEFPNTLPMPNTISGENLEPYHSDHEPQALPSTSNPPTMSHNFSCSVQEEIYCSEESN